MPAAAAALPLPVPTDAWPGTEAKLAVISERLARREELHHPDDRVPMRRLRRRVRFYAEC